MKLMILFMLTSTSLAAFSVIPASSAGAPAATPSVARPIQPARVGGPGSTTAPAAPERPKPPVSASPSSGGSDQSNTRPLPRGSLLDLAV